MQCVLQRRQRGQSIAVAAVVLVAIVGALAFVVDLGFQMETRRQLQSAADAGALAGVALLPDDQFGSIQQATTFAYQGANAAITDRICGPAASPLPDPGDTAPAAHPNVYSKTTPGQRPLGTGHIYTLTVTMECTVQFSFGRILNLHQAPIRASATAAKGAPKSVRCPFPMAIYDSDKDPLNGIQSSFGQMYQVGAYYPLYIKDDSGPQDTSESSSNTGSLDADRGAPPPGGAQAIKAAIANECSGPLVFDSGCEIGVPPCTWTKPGVSGGIRSGFTEVTPRYPNGRMDQCGSGPYCRPPLASSLLNITTPGAPLTEVISVTADYTCAEPFDDVVNPDGTVKPGKANSPCLATVPITSELPGNGGVNLPVEGYAMVFLAAFQKSKPVLVVQFVKNVQVQADIAAYNPLGSFVIRLIG